MLPITHMTLYKHGVGFFERRAAIDGDEVNLTFRVEDMNDVLKSLTVVDRGRGRVIGVDYATPQSREERLAGCSIRLGDDRSLRDLLIGLRGRRVALLLAANERASGELLGIDETSERQPLTGALVSLLLDGSAQVRVVGLEAVQGVEVLDEQGLADLRFFLATAIGQEQYRPVKIRLAGGPHDLSVSYVAPAPTWRVSYRLLLEPETDGKKPTASRALLQGWGIFDNRLEEDLKDISLSLVAGMPVSFIYDLYTPFTPDRPVVEEESRVAAAPVEFAANFGMAGTVPDMEDAAVMRKMAPAPMAVRSAASPQAFAESAPAQASGKSMGELFQYNITTPVTVGRGQSAMVPIVSADVAFKKDLIYSGAKLAGHPVAAVRLTNTTGLVLERGPATVLEKGEYVGEAILPFTAEGGELVVTYAVELGVKVSEEASAAREIHGLSLRRAGLYIEEWDIRRTEYRLNNNTARSLKVLIEHPRLEGYDVYDTPAPVETTPEHLRFEVQAPARAEQKLLVSMRRLVSRVEDFQRVSLDSLRRFLRRGLIDQPVYDRVAELLKIWEKIGAKEREIARLNSDREKTYKAQEQVRGAMNVLGQSGREGDMRGKYLDQMAANEDQLAKIAQAEQALRADIDQLKLDAEVFLQGLE
jgi:hypothetical protein